MNTEEAVLMIQSRLPHLGEETANKLASTLHQYPLVINYASGLLAHQDLSIDELLAETQELAANVPVEADTNLITVLERSLSLLKEKNELALFMLAIISFLDLNPYVHQKTLIRLVMMNEPATAAQLQCLQAVKMLCDFQLIEPEPKGILTIHPLTREVLQSLLIDEIYNIGDIVASWFTQYSARKGKVSEVDDMERKIEITYYINLLWHLIAAYDKDPTFTPTPEFSEELIPWAAHRILVFHRHGLRTRSYGLNPRLVRWAEERFIPDEERFIPDSD